VRAVDAFFEDLDGLWLPRPAEKIRLAIIGSAALMLQVDYQRGTKDSDILETAALTDAIRDRLLALAGNGTPLHMRHRVYLDIVARGLPFLRQQPRWHSVEGLNKSLDSFELFALDVVDVVVSKLKRFNANDRSDIEAMVDEGAVPHAELIVCFREGVDFYTMDARAADLPRYVKNLHTIERDLFDIEPTEIELPSWTANG
jgi:hypothetical protein